MNIYNYGFDYDFGTNAAPFLNGVAGFVLVFAVFFCLIALAFAAVVYVLQAIGLYSIAKRRGIHHSWLAWIPVGSAWLLGSISDQYRYVTKGSVKNRRSVLMGLEIAMLGVTTLLTMARLAGGMYGVLEQSGFVGIMAGLMTLLSVASAVVSVFCAVFHYIALHDLYASCAPARKVPFLILSIVFNATEPFFVFFNRNLDLGMPPRRKPMSVINVPVYDAEPVDDAPVEEVVAEPVVPTAPVETVVNEVPVEIEVPEQTEAEEIPTEAEENKDPE